MSILNTSVSGMLSDSNWLSTIAQNVSNSNTTGYKNVDTEFSALVDSSPGSPSQVAGVASTMTSYNTLQGEVASTQTSTDLAVQGTGFFLVSNSAGETFLTRNGSFVPDAQGNLVNSAGYYLMAAPTTNATAANQTVNSISGLQKVNVDGVSATATPSTTATMVMNLPSTATAITADTPLSNDATSTYTDETTLTAYDNLGAPHTINLYFTNTGSNTWEVDAFDSSTATNGGFPYGAAGSAPLATSTLTFDPTTGDLQSASPPLSFNVNANSPTVSVDLSNATQLATSFGVTSATINGNAPGTMTGVSVSESGVMSFSYSNGASNDEYIVPLASVPSPDNLTESPGGAYSTNSSSGALQVNNAQTAGLGKIEGSSLEGSTVDLATELTDMIQAQSAYEANSKVFQTGTNIFDVLNNLKS